MQISFWHIVLRINFVFLFTAHIYLCDFKKQGKEVKMVKCLIVGVEYGEEVYL